MTGKSVVTLNYIILPYSYVRDDCEIHFKHFKQTAVKNSTCLETNLGGHSQPTVTH